MAVSVITGVSAHAEADLAAVLGSASGLELVRRCADLAEVLSVAAAGRADVALISANFPGLDRSVLRDLRDHGVRVVGVFADETEERTLRQWGVTWLLADRSTESEVLGQVRAAADTHAQQTVATEDEEGARVDELPHDAPSGERDEPGKVLVVWGTGGAPGRSVFAAGLAVELADVDGPTLLADIDTYGASQAQLFGILDEAPGIAAAARLAEAGRLDTVSLAGVAPLIGARLRILTGLPRPDRWPEIRSAAIESVLETARSTHRWTVVDIAAAADGDEELSYDTIAPQRNMATRTALRAADEVFLLGSGDPIGLGRLVRAIDGAGELTDAPITVVVTKVRASAAGRHPEQQIRQALQRFSGVDPVLVPDDREALDAALLAGRSVLETAPGSSLSLAISDLVRERLGLTAMRSSNRRAGRRFRRAGQADRVTGRAAGHAEGRATGRGAG